LIELQLAVATSDQWLDAVRGDFNRFLLDHAANERKASAMAMGMVAHYPDRSALVDAMIDLAVEELNHFRQVVRVISQRGLSLGADEKDPYVNQLRAHTNKGSEDYFLDRLLIAAVIEARGAERFSLIAACDDEDIPATLYRRLAISESTHYQLFIELALQYFETARVDARLAQWIDMEKQIVEVLPIHPRLH
jgi:tRNA 2-(methylsulfanyl)-N6-isopentenyladenosine37 hydroxylase